MSSRRCCATQFPLKVFILAQCRSFDFRHPKMHSKISQRFSCSVGHKYYSHPLKFQKIKTMQRMISKCKPHAAIITIAVILLLSSCDRIMRAPDVVVRDIDCSEVPTLLDSVAISDQRVRTDASASFREKVETDYENLSTVVSIIESCGLPGLDELTQSQFNAIWMALHHSPETQYMKEYFPLFKEAKSNGDMRPQDYATVRDRMLMRDGKPQIYGTQIRNGKLYNLSDPEYVNQRREEVRLGQIEGYLARFNIEFNIEQKER